MYKGLWERRPNARLCPFEGDARGMPYGFYVGQVISVKGLGDGPWYALPLSRRYGKF